jgi:hypothetical protein
MNKIKTIVISLLLLAFTANASSFGGDTSFSKSTSFGKSSVVCGSPSSTNLKVWLSADNINGSNNIGLNNGDAVTTWTNTGSLGDSPTQGTVAAKPAYTTSCIGSKPCVRFDGGDFLLSSVAANYTFLHDGTGATIYTIAKTSASAIGTLVATATGSGVVTGIGMRYQTTFRTSYFQSDGTTLTVNSNSANNAINTSKFDLYATTFTSGANGLNQFVQGVNVATATAASVSALAPAFPMAVGARPDGAAGVVGDILQVLIYSGVDDSTKQAAIKTWAQCTYGVFPL